MAENKYVRFDWAMKYLLRQKANFVVLEGLISSLLNRKLKINRLLESESNQEAEDDKQNRVDILAEAEGGEKLIIEVQNANETAYFQRMLFGTSKLITEYLKKGDDYGKIKKVYSINIVFFGLGRGDDYLYRGRTEFLGVHSGNPLSLTPFQVKMCGAEHPGDLYPEYFIIKVPAFNNVVETEFDEWMRFLKDGEIPELPKAPGLAEAKEIMLYERMSEEERRGYLRHLDNIVVLRDNMETARGEGEAKGRAEGLAEGRAEGLAMGRAEGLAEGRAEGVADTLSLMAERMKRIGRPTSEIAEVTGLTAEAIEKL